MNYPMTRMQRQIGPQPPRPARSLSSYRSANARAYP